MGTFNRHVLKELFVSVGFWFLTLTVIGITIMLMQVFRQVPSLGLGFALGQAPYLLGYVCPHTLAIAAALSTTMVMGRLAANRELQAMRTSGVPQSRVLDPTFATAVVVAVVAMAFSLDLTPAAYRHKKALERESVLAILQRPPRGEQTHRLGRTYLLRYSGVRGNILIKPFIIERSQDSHDTSARAYFIAEDAEIDLSNPGKPQLVMRNCQRGSIRASEAGEPERIEETRAERFPIQIEIETRGGRSKDLDAMTLRELRKYAFAAQGPRRKQAFTRFHSRIAWSLAPFPLVLLAAGIGMTVRRSSRLAGLGATIPSLILYYGCIKLFINLSESGFLPPHVGPYLGAGVILIAAMGVIYWQCKG